MASMIAVVEDRLKALRTEHADLAAQAEAAKSFDGLRERMDAIADNEIPAAEADLARAKAANAIAKSAPAVVVEGNVIPVAPVHAVGSIADQVLGSEEWQGYMGKGANLFSPNVRVESPKIGLKGSLVSPMRMRAAEHTPQTGTSSTSAGALILPGQSGIWDEGPLRKNLTILDLITRGTTDSDAVEFVRTTSFTNNAAIVAEADDTDTTDNTGRKPWSSLALARVSVAVETIAHAEAATTRALADAGQMRTLIDSWLRYGLYEALEAEIINGAGGAGHFDGLTNVANTQTQTFDTNVITTLRRAKTKVRLNGKANANGILLHPNDWEALDLELTLAGTNSNRDAGAESTARVWGLPVVESETVAEGTAIVGDFSKAVLWDRQLATVQATSGYMDFFLKNMVAILAELRAAFGVIRPSAFVIVDVSSGS